MTERGRAVALAALLACPAALAAEDRFVAALPAPAELEVRRDIPYLPSADHGPAFDLYLPARRTAPPPVVVFVNGIGADWIRGHIQYTSWAKAVTARGLAGVTMDSREPSVDADLRALLAHLAAHSAELGVDGARVALWSCSANVQRGLPLAESPDAAVRSTVAYYGSAEVTAFLPDRPVLFVRAGLDGASLNHEIDALAARALGDNVPVEMINVAAGHHGFDIRDEAETSRAAIARTLDFLTLTLGPGYVESVRAGQGLAAAAGLASRGEWAAAAAAYATLVGSSPRDSVLWQRLAEAREETGDDESALAAYTRALALGTPNAGIVSFAVARLHARAGRLDEACAALRAMKPQLGLFLERLRTDAAFALLRRDPRFAALVAEVAAQSR